MKIFVAEFIGTFTLIFIGVGAITADFITAGALGLTGIALAHGLAIGTMVSATGAVSGGHLNPAVTIGAFTGGKVAARKVPIYLAAQLSGALAAAALIKLAMPIDALDAVGMGTPAVGPGITIVQALVTEVVLTFFLMFVIYGTAIDARAPKMGGLFIGLVVTMDVLMGGPISGAAMNPARHFGPALLGGGLQNMWLYWVGPIIGAVLAALVYHHVLEQKPAA